MNKILDDKIYEFENATEYECWYLVKQPTDFANLCYLVSFLEEYQLNSSYKKQYKLQEYIEKRVEEVNKKSESISISKNYRALRVAAFFGLIKMSDLKYENAKLTDTFYEIKHIVRGKYEDKRLYQEIITRQIEKMFVSSPIDEENEGVRGKYRLFSVILLYKILLELGKTNMEKYSVSMIEYRYLIATTKKYEDFLNTLLEITELRKNDKYDSRLDVFRDKFDNRMIQAIKQLDTLEVTSDEIQIKSEKLEEVRKKVYAFESSRHSYDEKGYKEFLGSNQTLYDLIGYQVNEDVIEQDIKSNFLINKPHQQIFFGAPGTGKSYKLNKEAKENFGNNFERVTFHPNYMYGNFVGAYKPFPKIHKDEEGNVLKNDHGIVQESITYTYVGGVFIQSLVKAFRNPKINYLIIVEEINRANVAAVFGDIFQLLDRDANGKSEYKISTSKELQEYLRAEDYSDPFDSSIKADIGDDFNSLILPSNFYVWATMNSADQGVMPMDTAFRRRWEFTYLGIDEAVDESFDEYKMKISENEIAKWDDFRRAVNAKLTACRIPEDKLIGPYFISKSILELKDINQITAIVRDKVLMYLYEDAAKAHRNTIFEDDKHGTYSLVCENFDINAKSLFKGGLVLETEEIEPITTEINGESE